MKISAGTGQMEQMEQIEKRDKDGFSLIEVLIALMIFTIGILGIMSLQGISLMSSDLGGNMTVARMLAQDQIDRLQESAFTATPLIACVTPYCRYDIGSGVLGATPTVNLNRMGQAEETGRFRRAWTVTDVETNVKQVAVRVSWTDAPGGATKVPSGSFNRNLEVRSIRINNL